MSCRNSCSETRCAAKRVESVRVPRWSEAGEVVWQRGLILKAPWVHRVDRVYRVYRIYGVYSFAGFTGFTGATGFCSMLKGFRGLGFRVSDLQGVYLGFKV